METVKPSENSTSDDRRTEFQQPKNSTSDNRQAGAQQPRTPGRRESVNPFGNGTSDDRQTGVRPSPAAHVKASRVREGARHTLVLDLDETLLHSSFEPTTADFIVPITVDGQRHTVYARKRPFVDYFLRKAGELFSVIVWTASVRSYAEPLIDALLSSAGTSVQVERMYRTECTELYGEYAKDLTKCSGSLDTVCLVDNSPAAACLQVKNHIPISSWFSDGSDTALLRLLPFLERVSCSHSVYDVLEPAQAVLEVQAKQLAQSEPIDIDVDRL
ncbi:putative phosphatase PSR2 [Diplonema papillatum]|nr:putative phosphatase PSR2 [Diplonema papillatum]